MHEGLAPGGALVPELLAAANRRVQNPDDTAAIEVMGTVTMRADGAMRVATDAIEPRDLRVGDEITVASERHRAAYLAVRGGIDAPVVLGSRSTQLSAGIGRLLRSGVRLSMGEVPIVSRPVEAFEPVDVVRVIPGPDHTAFATHTLVVLTSSPYVVLPSSDRVGMRLEGPALPGVTRRDVTRPMVCGAIEVPPDGRPIVLGPEHPTTGGYPVIAVVAHDDRGRCFARAPGQVVRFACLPLAAPVR